MALRNAAQVFGASRSSKRALKLNSPTCTRSSLINHPVLLLPDCLESKEYSIKVPIRYQSGSFAVRPSQLPDRLHFRFRGIHQIGPLALTTTISGELEAPAWP